MFLPLLCLGSVHTVLALFPKSTPTQPSLTHSLVDSMNTSEYIHRNRNRTENEINRKKKQKKNSSRAGRPMKSVFSCGRATAGWRCRRTHIEATSASLSSPGAKRSKLSCAFGASRSNRGRILSAKSTSGTGSLFRRKVANRAASQANRNMRSALQFERLG